MNGFKHVVITVLHNIMVLSVLSTKTAMPSIHYTAKLDVEANKDYLKSSLELNYTHAFRYASDGFQARFFGGGFLYKTNASRSLVCFSPERSLRGSEDYKFENLYLGRFEVPDVIPSRQVLLSQQFTADQGGFASFYPFARSDKWLVSFSVQYESAYVFPCISMPAPAPMPGQAKTKCSSAKMWSKSVSLPYEAGAMIKPEESHQGVFSWYCYLKGYPRSEGFLF